MWGASTQGGICLIVSCLLRPSGARTAGPNTHSLPTLASAPVILLTEHPGDGGNVAGGLDGCKKMQATGGSPPPP